MNKNVSTMKADKIFFIIIVLKITLIISGCSEDIGREPPETPLEVLNEKVRSAPYQFIDLDEVETTEIVLADDDILFSVTGYHADEELLLGDISSVVHHDDRLFFYDRTTNAVYKLNIADGGIEGPLTREGRGPGEHLLVRELNINDRYVFVTDLNSSRINRYTHDMVPVQPLENFLPSPTAYTLVLNNEKILTGNWNSGAFIPQDPDQGLISIHPIHDLADTLSTIMPRIIPVGYQPFGYNATWFSINSHNRIAAHYGFLPWLFLYDKDYDHMQTLILKYSFFDQLDIPPMDIFRPVEGEGFGGQRPITQFQLMDNGDLFLTINTLNQERDTPRKLIQLSLSSEGTYQAVGKYTFSYAEVDGYMWNYNSIPIAAKENDVYYSWNPEYLFRFELPGSMDD